MATLPDILGHPTYDNNHGFGGYRSISDHKQLMDESLQIVYMTPMDTKISKSINIYEGRNAQPDFIKYLRHNGVEPGNAFQSGYLQVACSNITPLSETYSNEYGQSELFGSLQQIGNGALGEAAQIMNFKGREDINEYVAKEGGNEFLKGLAGFAKDTLDWGEDTLKEMGFSEHNAKTFINAVSNPAAKIDIPQMWKGNSFSASYEISVRLQCFNATDDKDYLDNVVAPLIALMQFVTPRSDTGNFYTWPFLLSFEIPGLVDLPLAYCSNLTVIKGGDVNDISWKWRPNIIDCRMSINTIWGVTVNSLKESKITGDRPMVKNTFDILSKMKGNSSSSSSRNAALAQAAAAEAAAAAAASRNSPKTEGSEGAQKSLT